MDTSVVVSADPPSLRDDDLFVTAITFAELHAAVLGASNEGDRARRLRRLTKLVALYDPLPLDAGVAIAYGRIAAMVGQSQVSHPSQTMARLIAATALANGCRLYTRRPGEFGGLESVLEVIGV
jgi:predicted nucleic acid-binding protein